MLYAHTVYVFLTTDGIQKTRPGPSKILNRTIRVVRAYDKEPWLSEQQTIAFSFTDRNGLISHVHLLIVAASYTTYTYTHTHTRTHVYVYI